METRHIGSLEVSAVGLGCNNFGRRLDSDATASVIAAALDAGINFLDTADVYGGTKSEEFIGRVIRGRRDDVIIATKFGSDVDDKRQGAKPNYVLRACDDSLKRLATDHIDLYQLHEPDPTTPIPYFPLASGLLSGKYRRGKRAPKGSRLGSGWHVESFNDRNLDIVESLIAFAESRGHTLLELAVSWLASHDLVASVIAGATSPDQARANAVAASWRLTAEEMAEVDAIAL